MEFHRHFFVLFVSITAVTSRHFPVDELSQEDVMKIQEIVREMQQQGENKDHHHLSYDHEGHHADDHDYTNIQTLNLVFKHNNIGPSRPVARIGAGDDPQTAGFSEILCKFSGRCNGDLLNEDFIALDKEDDKNPIYDRKPLVGDNYANYINYKDAKKYIVDDNKNLENLLDDYEKALTVKTEDNAWDTDESSEHIKIRCKGSKCEVLNPYDDINGNYEPEDSMTQFLNDLEIALGKSNDEAQRCGCNRDNYNEDDDIDDATRLRCGCTNKRKRTCCNKNNKKCNSCRAGDREDSEEDDKAFTRCCRKCATIQYYRASDGNPVIDNEEGDDRAYLHCCKQCGRSEHFRNVIVGTGDSQEENSNGDRIIDSIGRDVEIPDRAKVYPMNDDLDAIVVDVSELDSIIKLANNGNNLGNVDSNKKYVRGGKDILKPVKVPIVPIKRIQNRMLPLTKKQKQKHLKIRQD